MSLCSVTASWGPWSREVRPWMPTLFRPPSWGAGGGPCRARSWTLHCAPASAAEQRGTRPCHPGASWGFLVTTGLRHRSPMADPGPTLTVVLGKTQFSPLSSGALKGCPALAAACSDRCPAREHPTGSLGPAATPLLGPRARTTGFPGPGVRRACLSPSAGMTRSGWRQGGLSSGAPGEVCGPPAAGEGVPAPHWHLLMWRPKARPAWSLVPGPWSASPRAQSWAARLSRPGAVACAPPRGHTHCPQRRRQRRHVDWGPPRDPSVSPKQPASASQVIGHTCWLEWKGPRTQRPPHWPQRAPGEPGKLIAQGQPSLLQVRVAEEPEDEPAVWPRGPPCLWGASASLGAVLAPPLTAWGS